MRIHTSSLWNQPSIIFTILRNAFVLDPTIFFVPHTLFIARDKKNIYGFITVKYHGKGIVERGTLYVYPQWRNKGYGRKLMRDVMRKYKNLYVICKKADSPLKEKQGFKTIPLTKAPAPLRWRAHVYNTVVSPLLGSTLVVMRCTQ